MGETVPVYHGDAVIGPMIAGLPRPYRVPQWYFDLKPAGAWFTPGYSVG